jgi:tRNA(fMet)-specific endonuclease VapC
VYILDTDHLTLLQRDDSPDGNRLRRRLETVPEEGVATSIISFEEQSRGWLAAISSAKSTSDLIAAYQRLIQLLYNYRKLIVREFNESAAAHFNRLKRSRIRVGSNDLRIASIALARNEILLTRNTKDFSKVPNLKFEDWCR